MARARRLARRGLKTRTYEGLLIAIQAAATQPIAAMVHSDILVPIRTWSESQPSIAHLCRDLPKWRVLVDANVLIQDVCHRAHLRNPQARTALEELIANGTVEAFVTVETVAEVDRHLPHHARRIGREEAVVLEIWGEYLDQLEVVAPPTTQSGPDVEAIRARDPDDEHLVAAAMAFAIDAIMTDDKDLSVTSIPAFRRPVLLSMRDVARFKANQLALELGPPAMGTFATVILVDVCRHLPPGWLAALGVALALALMHPWVRGQLRVYGAGLLLLLQELATESERARLGAQHALDKVVAGGLPGPSGVPAS